MSTENTMEDFWGCTLTKGKKEYSWSPVETEEDIEHKLQVTSACLGPKAKQGERNLVEVTTEDDQGNQTTCSIVSLSVGQKECFHLELGFNNPTKFTLREGSGPISLCGVHLQAAPIDFSDVESDEEDEDIPNLVEAKVDAKPTKPGKRPLEEEKKDDKQSSKKKKLQQEPEDDSEEEEDDDEEEDDSEDDEEEESEDEEMPSLLDGEAEEADDDEDSEDEDEPEADEDSDEDEEEDSEDEEDEEEEEEEKPTKKKPMTNGHTPKNKQQQKQQQVKSAGKKEQDKKTQPKTPVNTPKSKTPAKDKKTPGKGPTSAKKTAEEIKALIAKSTNTPKKIGQI